MVSSTTAIPNLVEMVVATTRYLGALTELTDEELRGPSLLPDWTRGHVVTHLARNADGLCNLLNWAETGVETPMYASREQRDADIEAGAGRSAHDLRADASASAGRLLQAVNELDVRHADVLVARMTGGTTLPAREIATVRLVEVEIHHADLDIGYSNADWPEEFADLLIGRVQDDRADEASLVLSSTDSPGLWKFGQGQGPEIKGTKADLAWWLVGRGDGSGLVSSTGELPELPRWR